MVSLYPFIHPALFPCISWIVPPAICLHSASSLNQRGELKAGCIFEPVWLLSCSGSCVSCLWFNGSSLCDIISLHLPPSSAHACIRFITLAIPSLILHLGPSLSCPPRSRSSSPPQSLLSTFTNAPWFRSMWWKWQTVSSTEGKRRGGVCGLSGLSWTLHSALCTRWAWQIARGSPQPPAHLRRLPGSSCFLIKSLMAAKIGVKAE